MSAALDSIVRLDISSQTATVATVSTTVPLILGTSSPGWPANDVVHNYTSASDLLTDGFTSTSVEYLWAQALTAQRTVPTNFLVGRRSEAQSSANPQIDTIAVGTVTAAHVYSFTLGSKVYSYTSVSNDTKANILQGLTASVVADPNAVVTAVFVPADSVIELTANVGGQSLTYSAVDSNLTQTTTQPSAAAQHPPLSDDDLVAVQGQDDSWYGLVLAGASDADIQTAAAWVESNYKRLFAVTADPECADSTNTSNVLSTLVGENFSRTALIVSPLGYNTGVNSAWVGDQLPQVPGSNNWNNRTLMGQVADKWSSSQLLTLRGVPVAGTGGRFANVFTTVQGVDVMQLGRNVDGSYIDDEIGKDWLRFNIQAAVFQSMVDAPGKIPYTDAGVGILLAAVHSVLNQGVSNGLIDDTAGITVTAPKVSTVPKAQRAGRVAPTISFACTLQGAINAINIVGTIQI